MNRVTDTFPDAPDTRGAIIEAIEAHIARKGMTPTGFGAAALKDPSFMGRLDRGSDMCLHTADKVLAFLGFEPIGPRFRSEVKAFLSVMGGGARDLGLEGPVDPMEFRAVLEGEVPDGSGRRLGRTAKDGEVHHRPGRDLTFSASKSVSLAALVGGDARIVDAHDRAVGRALDWFERNAAETRMKDPETGRMVRAGGQKTVNRRSKLTPYRRSKLTPSFVVLAVVPVVNRRVLRGFV